MGGQILVQTSHSYCKEIYHNCRYLGRENSTATRFRFLKIRNYEGKALVIRSNKNCIQWNFKVLPPGHSMQHNTEETFQKHHQGPSEQHPEAEIFSLELANLSGKDRKSHCQIFTNGEEKQALWKTRIVISIRYYLPFSSQSSQVSAEVHYQSPGYEHAHRSCSLAFQVTATERTLVENIECQMT